ncbi:MAG: hypothetical protein HRJ53_17785, partial [Acidobacteria bacterium Pan2503]|nr:hypothetical protein [Candidatus Acidoferrum panamensis]
MARTLPVVPGVIKVSLGWLNGGVQWGSNIHFHYSSAPPDDATCAQCAGLVALEFGAAVMPNLSNDCAFNHVEVMDLSSKSGGVAINSPSTIGGHTEPTISDSACFMLNHKIKQRYRGGKPRTYLPGVVTIQCTDGKTLTSAAINAINTGWDLFVGNMRSGSSGMAI